MTGLLSLLDNEIEELRWAMLHYWKAGDFSEARKCFYELQGVRRARRMTSLYVAARSREGLAA